MKLFTRIDGATTRQTWRILARELKRDRKKASTFFILLPLNDFLRTVYMPLVISFIIQALISQPHSTAQPTYLIVALAIGSLVAMILNHIGFTILFNHEEKVVTRLTRYAMAQLLERDYVFFTNHKVGALAGDVINFSRSYLTIMDATFLNASRIIVNFFSSLLIIAILSPILLLPLGLLTIGIIVLSIRALQKRSVYRNERKKQQSALSGLIADTLGNHLLVRIFAREKSEVDASISSRRSIEKIAAKEIDLIERESILRQSLLFGFQIITIAIGIWLFTNNSVSIAALIFAITYLGRLTDSLFSITSIIRQYEQAFLDAAPLTKILSEPPKVTDMPNAKNLAISNGTIEFANITFCYDDGDDVFSSLSLTIAPGQRVGLAGPSGGGKTTLTKLLLRFADVQNGKILIDNQDIAEFTQDSLRSNIAYVPQDTFLFHRTLRENIAYGRPDATEDEIIMAAEKSYAMEFIRKMPQGLDTVVGERGVKLSGGQRQRISIARAFIKDAPILILDEATSALDSESEKLIQKALHELMKNRTSIVIAHRLSTIASLDRIIVIDKGEIVEDDTHTSLIQQQGMYARLWNHQSGGFIED